MSLPDKAIEEFKEIYLEEFGVELEEKEAEERANSVFDLIKMLLTTK